MCVLNRLGTTALGSTTLSVAYANENVARVPPALVGIEAGNPRWLNDSVLIFQAKIRQASGQEVYQLCTWDSTRWDAPIQGADSRGQNELYAGGNRWAAKLNNPSYREWALNFTNNENTVWAPLDVDQATGNAAVFDLASGITYIWSGASLVEVTRKAILPQPTYKDGTLLYRTSNGPKFAAWPALSVPPAQITVQGGRAGCWHSGGWRLSYPSDALGLVVHGWASKEGLQIHAPGESTTHDNNPDIQAMPDGTIQVVSAKTEGEMPADFQRYVVNMTARTVNGHPRAWVNLA